MSEELIISISGMRGIIGENLTAEIATEYGCGFGTFLKDKYGGGEKELSVCIGRDSRPSGEMLREAVTSGLCSVGIDVIDLGIVTTPGVGIMLRELKCEGGIVITASHNPSQYNGIKLLLDNGIAPQAAEAEKIKSCYFAKDFSLVDEANCGRSTVNGETNDFHISKVLAIIDKDLIRQKSFHVVLDSVNGAGGVIGKKLLAELSCKVVAINDEPTGDFAHTPEPIAENLTGLCEVVKKERAHVGFAQDPDADRLAIVDEAGVFIGEEYTLALAAKYIFSKQSGSAAVNLSTSRMIDDIAAKAGGRVYRTAVGEANVAGAMIEHNCVIGGEGNGGVIDLRIGPIRDSLLSIVLVLQLMAETGKSISELVGEIGSYYMRKDKFTADKAMAEQIIGEAKKIFSDAKVDTTDGCRFDFEGGWLHLRTSNTEPIMRIIVEAKDAGIAQKYLDAVAGIRQEIVG
ncbi:MAG: phosphoglucosamine mutase [Planctomycetes bacterium]|nr:phosphoglucosamine mutase [Planctomycetota bacterium]